MLPKVAIYFLFETVYTNLVVIAVYAFLRLPKLSELWIEFRTKKTMEFISVHEISKNFGPPVIDNYFFMHLAVAILLLHLVEKIKSCLLNPGKSFQS